MLKRWIVLIILQHGHIPKHCILFQSYLFTNLANCNSMNGVYFCSMSFCWDIKEFLNHALHKFFFVIPFYWLIVCLIAELWLRGVFEPTLRARLLDKWKVVSLCYASSSSVRLWHHDTFASRSVNTTTPVVFQGFSCFFFFF